MTKWMAAHEANPVDIHVGARIRLRRKLLGVSQDDLAAALGLTFQQVQKYERGINRVSASKLYAIAGELNVPVSFFFDGLGQSDAGSSIETQGRGVRYFLETPEGRELAQSFPKIEAVALRRRILDLVHAMSDASAVSG